MKWLEHNLVCRRHLTITTNLVTLYCGTLANIRIHSERQNLHLSYSVPTLFNPRTSMTSLANIRPYGLNTSSTPIASLHFLAHLTVLPPLAILTAMSISLPAFSRIAAIGNASAPWSSWSTGTDTALTSIRGSHAHHRSLACPTPELCLPSPTYPWHREYGH